MKIKKIFNKKLETNKVGTLVDEQLGSLCHLAYHWERAQPWPPSRLHSIVITQLNCILFPKGTCPAFNTWQRCLRCLTQSSVLF